MFLPRAARIPTAHGIRAYSQKLGGLGILNLFNMSQIFKSNLNADNSLTKQSPSGSRKKNKSLKMKKKALSLLSVL